MIKLIVIFVGLSVCFISCSHSKRKKDELIDSHKQIMDVTSYTGNAVAFFSPNQQNSETISIIPVDEKDSAIFKQEDIYEAVKGKCAIRITDGYVRHQLLDSPKKKTLLLDICNVYSAVYYAKVWISYKGYLENTPKSKFPYNTDSCSIRVLGWSVDEKGKVTDDGIKQFIVLSNYNN